MTSAPLPPAPPSSPSGILIGAHYLIRGLTIWARRPSLMLLGALPALLVSAVLTGAIVALAINASRLAQALTPFAGDWSASIRDGLRLALSVGLVVAAIGLSVLAFTWLTLLVGSPAYDRISAAVDQMYAGITAAPQPWTVQLRRAVGNALRTLGVSLAMGMLVLLIGLIPVVGPVAAPVTAALVGAWALAVDLTGTPCEARGLNLTQRRTLLRRHRHPSRGSRSHPAGPRPCLIALASARAGRAANTPAFLLMGEKTPDLWLSQAFSGIRPDQMFVLVPGSGPGYDVVGEVGGSLAEVDPVAVHFKHRHRSGRELLVDRRPGLGVLTLAEHLNQGRGGGRMTHAEHRLDLSRQLT